MAKNTIRNLQIKAQEDGKPSQSIQDTYSKELKDTTGLSEAEAKAYAEAKKKAARDQALADMTPEELENEAANKRTIAKADKARPKNLADHALSILKLVKGK